MMLPYITIKKFSEESYYTVEAIESKIKRNDWVEGQEYVKAPDRRNLISREGYAKWVESGCTKESKKPLRLASKSRSTIRQNPQDKERELSLSPPPLT